LDGASPHLAHDRLLSAMRVVESLPPSARGAFLVGSSEAPIGTILIEANRVCWGAAPGMGGRLMDILRSHCDESRRAGEFDTVYARCRRESRPLPDALMASGLVSAERMRAAIKQHTIESLLAVDAAVANLCGSHSLRWPMQWIDHEGHGYNPRYTFGAVEVLAAAGAQRLEQSDAAVMTEHLEQLTDADSALVAFSFQPDGTPLFVAASSPLPMNLEDLIELSTWAEAALGACAGFSPGAMIACLRAADGGAAAWRYHGHYCAGLCVSGASLQRLTTSLENKELALVLATRPRVLDRVRERLNQGE
jgi:hypothetical protein